MVYRFLGARLSEHCKNAIRTPNPVSNSSVPAAMCSLDIARGVARWAVDFYIINYPSVDSSNGKISKAVVEFYKVGDVEGSLVIVSCVTPHAVVPVIRYAGQRRGVVGVQAKSVKLALQRL